MWLLYGIMLTMVLFTVDRFLLRKPSECKKVIGALIIAAVVLFMLIAVGNVDAQQVENNKYDTEKDNWWEWRAWTADQKIYYTWGVLSGAYAMADDLSYNSGYVDLLQIARDIMPNDYQVRDYVIAIEWIYEEPDMRKLPMWLIIFRVDELLEIRREYEQRK